MVLVFSAYSSCEALLFADELQRLSKELAAKAEENIRLQLHVEELEYQVNQKSLVRAATLF